MFCQGVKISSSKCHMQWPYKTILSIANKTCGKSMSKSFRLWSGDHEIPWSLERTYLFSDRVEQKENFNIQYTSFVCFKTSYQSDKVPGLASSKMLLHEQAFLWICTSYGFQTGFLDNSQNSTKKTIKWEAWTSFRLYQTLIRNYIWIFWDDGSTIIFLASSWQILENWNNRHQTSWWRYWQWHSASLFHWYSEIR